jgi:hypothetical protein
MATLLDVGILSHFGSFFVFALLFALLYGIMESTKPFGGEKRGLHAFVALVIALLFLVSRMASNMVAVLVPWFIIIAVFIFFVLLLFRMFGATDDTFKKVIGQDNVYPWIIVFSLLVLFGALGSVFGQYLLEAGGGGPTPTSAGGGGVVYYDSNGTPVYSPYDDGVGATTSTTTNSFAVNFMNTVRNPKVMGLIFILLTGAFLMIFLTKPVK